MRKYFSEGELIGREENKNGLKSLITMQNSLAGGQILEAVATICDSEHNLFVDLGFMKGIIPREEGAMGISEGTTKDIALISRVNKPVSFKILGFTKDNNGKPLARLSRKAAQQECYDEYISKLKSGDIIDVMVTHLENFGCFVDIGCGISSLIPIDSISVSRISHPSDRFHIGQMIKAVVKGFDQEGRVCLTHKELLGSWKQNADNFNVGETVAGIVRSIEEYGIFVELAPNLAGLAELKEGVKVGQSASVYVKSMIPEKMKVKLIIVDSFYSDYVNNDLKYYIEGDHIDKWQYSPECCEKNIVSEFK